MANSERALPPLHTELVVNGLRGRYENTTITKTSIAVIETLLPEDIQPAIHQLQLQIVDILDTYSPEFHFLAHPSLQKPFIENPIRLDTYQNGYIFIIDNDYGIKLLTTTESEITNSIILNANTSEIECIDSNIDDVLADTSMLERIQKTQAAINSMRDALQQEVTRNPQKFALQDTHEILSLVSMYQEEDPIKQREQQFQISMLEHYVLAGGLDKHMVIYQHNHPDAIGDLIEQEGIFANRYLHKIDRRYNERSHDDGVTIGPELELSPEHETEDIQYLKEQTARKMGLASTEELNKLVANTLTDPEGYEHIQRFLNILQVYASPEIRKNQLLYVKGRIAKLHEDLEYKQQLYRIVEYFSELRRIMTIKELTDQREMRTMEYELPKLLSFGNTIPFNNSELKVMPTLNEDIINLEILALIKQGKLRAAVFPQIKVNVKTDHANTQMMDAVAIGVAGGIFIPKFSNSDIKDFQKRRSFYSEVFPKNSPTKDSPYYIPFLKAIVQGRNDRNNREIIDYPREQAYVTEIRVFTKIEDQEIIETPYQNYFRLGKEHWYHTFKRSMQYLKLIGIVVSAEQLPHVSRSTKEQLLAESWKGFITEWEKGLQRIGLRNITQEKRIVEIINPEGFGTTPTNLNTPYGTFITNIIGKTGNRTTLQNEFKSIIDNLRNTVERVTKVE